MYYEGALNPSVVVATLEEVDTSRADEVDEPVLLRDAWRAGAGGDTGLQAFFARFAAGRREGACSAT